MKCPACGFVCFDQSDICTKCFLDLRELKRELGLPISEPSLSYHDLLAKALPMSQETSSPSPRNSIWHSFFTKKAPSSHGGRATSAPVVNTSSENQAHDSTEVPLQVQVSPLEITKPLPATSKTEIPVIKAGDHFQENTPPPDTPETTAPLWHLPEVTESLDEIINQIFTDSEERPTPAESSPSIKPSDPHPFPQYSLESNRDAPPVIPPEKAVLMAETADNDENSTKMPAQKTPLTMQAPHPAAGEGVRAAFELAFAELGLPRVAVGFDLSSAQLRTPPSKEEVRLLFDVAEHVLTDTNAEKELEAAPTSVDRRLKTEELEQQLKETEREINAAWSAMRPLHVGKTVRGGRGDGQLRVQGDAIKPVPAPLDTRVMGSMVDFFCSLLCAAVMALCYAWLFEPELRSSLFDISRWDILFWISIAALTAAALPICSFAYLALCLGICHRTIGEEFSGINTLKSSGAPLQLEDVLVRSTCWFPLLLLGGGLLTLIGKRSLLDRIGDTVSVKS